MFVYRMHSGVRYLVLLLGVLALGYALYGIVTRRPYDQTMRKLAGLFSVSLQINVLIGLALLFTGTSFYAQLGSHVLAMVAAAVVAQIVPSVMRRRPMEERTYPPHLVNLVVALALVVVGVLSIPGGSIFGSRL
jgi:uncharacterized membrane protein YidH (DUF202 family)